MQHYNNAISFDSQGNVKQAIQSYRQSVADNEGVVESYINLSVILWDISTDYGVKSYFLSTKQFTGGEIAEFPKEYSNLLNEGASKFPDNIEIKFWQKYIRDRDDFVDIDCKYINELLHAYKDFIVPIFCKVVYCEGATEEELGLLKDYLSQQPKIYKTTSYTVL